MTDANSFFFYVADATGSARFYADLLGFQPVEASPTFALFVFPSGLALGLWGRDGVQPTPVAAGGGSEIGFKVKDAAGQRRDDRVSADRSRLRPQLRRARPRWTPPACLCGRGPSMSDQASDTLAG